MNETNEKLSEAADLVDEVKTGAPKKLRQIIIETDGNKIRIVKSEVAGDLELSAIMRAILNNIER